MQLSFIYVTYILHVQSHREQNKELVKQGTGLTTFYRLEVLSKLKVTKKKKVTTCKKIYVLLRIPCLTIALFCVQTWMS